MNNYQDSFIQFMVRSGVLTFGDFTTKSGRKTPFFINTGNYRTGAQMARLGEFYAQAVVERFGGAFDLLFGPAYKGIPLVVTTAIALAEKHGIDVPCCFNRKEAKDHGEGGSLVGQKPQDGQRVLIVEDVTTAGTSIRETIPVLRASAPGVKIAGLLVSVDRQERGAGARSALSELAAEFDMKACAIVTMDEVVAGLHNKQIDGCVVLDDAIRARIDDYRKQYGATA
jgi:orotate phosphoribosyltransferase